MMTSAAQVVPPIPNAKHNRFAFLDLMRFLAAIGVVGYHYTASKYAPWLESAPETFNFISRFSKYGLLGVDLFFLISGFVILMSAYQRSAGHFVASRFSRIFPALWVMVVLGALMKWFIWPERGANLRLQDVLVNFTLVVEPTSSVYVDGVLWTLWTEMRFYLLIFFFILWGINQQRVILVSLLWPVAAFIAAQAGSPFLIGLLMPSSAPLFAGGMMMFVIYKWGWNWLKAGGLLANVAWAAVQSTNTAVSGVDKHTVLAVSDLKVTILVLLIFTVVGICVLTPVRSISVRWMTWLGLFTYPLYLIHELWGWFIIDRLAPVMTKYAVLAVAVAVSFLLAYLIIKFVEKPLSGKIRNRIIQDLERIKLQDDTEKELLEMAQGKFRKSLGGVTSDFNENPAESPAPHK